MTTRFIYLSAILRGHNILIMAPSCESKIQLLSCPWAKMSKFASHLSSAWALLFLLSLFALSNLLLHTVLWMHTDILQSTHIDGQPALCQPYGLPEKAGMNELAALSILPSLS